MREGSTVADGDLRDPGGEGAKPGAALAQRARRGFAWAMRGRRNTASVAAGAEINLGQGGSQG
jgi:hypothetical protein